MGFDAFVRLEGPRLKGLARLLVGEDWLAEELLQDVLARCLPRWEQISAGDPVAYIRRSLIHARVSHWRKFRRETLGTVPEHSVASYEAALLEALFLESLLRRLSGGNGRSSRCAIPTISGKRISPASCPSAWAR